MTRGAPDAFAESGWALFPVHPQVAAWAEAARPAAHQALRDPANSQWLRCGGTWFVGVDCLPNDAEGAVAGGPPLAGPHVDFIAAVLHRTPVPWHRGQISVCYPGYPQPSPDESASAFQYRLKRDAAHVDGLLAEGPERRRHLREPHAFILGIPLVTTDAGASPLVVWEGSHRIMARAFRSAIGEARRPDWQDTDVTLAYQAARRDVFANCRRIEIPTVAGQACILHRHLLHGVAPWSEGAKAGEDGRMIAYFRPQYENAADWLDQT